MQAGLYPPVFSLGQELCGEKASGGFVFGATTATPATLPDPFFNFIMTDLTEQQTDTSGRNTDYRDFPKVIQLQ